MLNFIKAFQNDEDGAVTVDFVVVTAAVVGMGIAVLATVADGALDSAVVVNNDMETDIVAQSYSAVTD